MHGKLENVFAAVERSRPNFILSCGDWGEQGCVSEKEFQELLNLSKIYTVFGNHDDIAMLSAAVNTDGTPVLMKSGTTYDFGTIRVGAINGIWAKSHEKPCYVTGEEVSEYARLLAAEHPDILISHACAIGLADEVPGGRHAGQRSWLDAYKIISPRLYLCGHLHLAQKRVLKDERLIVNVGSTGDGDYWVFEVDEKTVRYEQHRL
jgi:Icc-related predicted phosphoesterase